MKARTSVSLDAEQLQALRAEARVQGIPLAALMRRLVQQHLDARQGIPPPSPDAYLKIVALGASGRRDVAECHDQYLGEALRREHAR